MGKNKRSASRDAYISQNSTIRVNTASLRAYADRLDKVNSRLRALDTRIERLYMQTGWLDLLLLMESGLNTGCSGTLKRCAEYLNHTAESFEAAERSILSKI